MTRVVKGIRIQTLECRLPRGIAATYRFGYKGKSIPTFTVNSRLTAARRREAQQMILANACGVFDQVRIADLAA